jgi:hypothetical protein
MSGISPAAHQLSKVVSCHIVGKVTIVLYAHFTIEKPYQISDTSR